MPHPPDQAAQVAAVVAVLASLAALWMTSLVPGAACLLAAVFTVGSAVALRYVPALTESSSLRVTVALTLLAAVAVTGGRSAPDLPLFGPLEIIPTGILAALAAGALVSAVLEFGTARGVRFGVVLTTAVLGLTAALAPGPHMVPALCVGWPAALFTLARVNGVESLARSRSGGPQAGAPGRAVLRWHVVPAVATIVVACVALVLLRANGLAGQDGPGAADAFGNDGGLQGNNTNRSVSRSATSYLGSTMDLRMRGTLSDTPIFSVPLDSPSLWRSGVLDTYQDTLWIPGDGAGERPTISPEADGIRLNWRSVILGEARSDVVQPNVDWASVVIAAGRPDSVVSAEAGRDAALVAVNGERLVFVHGDAPAYRVESTTLPRVADPAIASILASVAVGSDVASGAGSDVASGAGSDVASGAGSGVGSGVDPRFTALPDSVPQRVLDLGKQLVGSAPDRRAAVLAVENELRRRIEYRLDSPRPRRGDDPVDDVLFRSNSGFCEQFAASEVVLLRAAGVPARMATGFAGGTPSGDRRVLKAEDGHAWVEVWFPGVGWVSSDPTAGSRKATAWWSDLATLGRRFVGNPLALASVVLALVAGVAIAALAVRRRSRSSAALAAASGPRGRELPPDLAAAFTRLEAALKSAGQPRLPAETVATLGSRLDCAGPLSVVERALYAKAPPSGAECAEAAASLDKISTNLLSIPA